MQYIKQWQVIYDKLSKKFHYDLSFETKDYGEVFAKTF